MMIEITFFGRGGQGGKTSAFIFGVNAMKGGLYFKAFPEYGPERSGAPVKAFIRVSDTPIKLHSNIYEPDVLVLLDTSLMKNALSFITENTKVILNSNEENAKQIASDYELKEVWFLDATKISLEEIGKNYPNIPMLGGLQKVVNISSLENLKDALVEVVGSKWDEKVIKQNQNALQRGFDEIKKL